MAGRAGIATGLALAGAALALALGAVAARGAAPAQVTVTAGSPRETSLVVTPRGGVPAGAVRVRVVNAGRLSHAIRLCTPRGGSASSACTGPATPLLAPGRSATLSAALAPGTYTLASATPSEVAKGMRAVLRVLPATPAATTAPAAAAAPTASAPAATTAAATTTAAAPEREALLGDPSAGALLFRDHGCGQCHTLAAAGATGADAPSLDARRPSQAKVMSNVQLGAYGGSGIVMPQFFLSATDLANLAAFVYQATHP